MSIIKNKQVRKHKPIVVAEIWLFTIIILGLLITGIPLLRDAIYGFMGIYGGLYFETPTDFDLFHTIFGFILIIIGLLHIAIHAGDKDKNLLTKNPAKDFKAFLHSVFYLIKLSRREEPGGGDRYSGRQRIVYLALAYTIGLAAISGITLFLISSDNELSSIFTLTHIVMAITIILILIFHAVITLRRHDLTALKCSFATGKLPLWYVKKHQKIWLTKIKRHEKKIARQRAKHQKEKSTTS